MPYSSPSCCSQLTVPRASLTSRVANSQDRAGKLREKVLSKPRRALIQEKTCLLP
jgi:hypothetical protein